MPPWFWPLQKGPCFQQAPLLGPAPERQERATLSAAATAASSYFDCEFGFDRESGLDRETGLGEALFEDRYPVMAPERFAFEDEERYAEDVIGFRLLLRATVGEGALALEIFAILFGGETQIRDQRGDGIRLVGFELAAEKKFVRLAAVIEQEEAGADNVFGVPLFIFEREPFWGHDRIPILEQRLTEAGLAIKS